MIRLGIFFALLAKIYKMIKIDFAEDNIFLRLLTRFILEKNPDKEILCCQGKFTDRIEDPVEKQRGHTQYLKEKIW